MRIRIKIYGCFICGSVFIYLAGIMGVFSNGLIKELMAINQEQMFLGLILLAIALFVLIQSIFSAINILYYSKDK